MEPRGFRQDRRKARLTPVIPVSPAALQNDELGKSNQPRNPNPPPRKLPKPARPILESTVPESVAIDLRLAGRISPAEIRCPRRGRCFRRSHAFHLPGWSNLYA